VGSVSGAEYTWELAHQQLQVRLLLAGQKTNTVDQRSTLVAAIVVSKLLYIGRHQWPCAAMVTLFQKRIHNFVWHGYFSAAKRTGRAWLNPQVAALPRSQGGIAEHNLISELHAMAASTVAEWAIWSTPAELIVGDVLGDPRARADQRHFLIGASPLQPTQARPGRGTLCGTRGQMFAVGMASGPSTLTRPGWCMPYTA
jgi:hypothetical protein